MELDKDYTYILHENPPQALLNDSQVARKVLITYLSGWRYDEMQFINSILPHLQSMKMKTNGDNNRYRYYLQFSTLVAQILICNIRKKLWDPKMQWDIVNVIGKLDMEKEFRESQYEVYRNFLEKECRRMGIIPSSIDYGLLTRIGIVLIGAIIWYMEMGSFDSFIFGGLIGSILAGAHYLHAKK